MKIVVWGHPLHTHTHSYIHASFFRAFRLMGYDVVWKPNAPVNSDDYANCLFLTEGQSASHMPLRDDCRYVLHNCTDERYRNLDYRKQAMILQVYSNDVGKRAANNPTYEKLGNCIFFEKAEDGVRVLYQPWATDLMPDEIDLADADKPHDGVINWVGTIGGGEFGNDTELEAFRVTARRCGTKFIHYTRVKDSEHRILIQKSVMAPAIVGLWQRENGYIPCRMFKNVSYGKFPATNSSVVHEVMEGRGVCSKDTRELFFAIRDKTTIEATKEAMEFVKQNHTYVNRIQTIFSCLGVE